MKTNQYPQLPWQIGWKKSALLIKNCFHLIRYKIHSMISATEIPSRKLKTLIQNTKKKITGNIMPHKGKTRIRQELSIWDQSLKNITKNMLAWLKTPTRSFAKLQFSRATPLRFWFRESGWDLCICNFNKTLGVSEYAGDLQAPHTYYLITKDKVKLEISGMKWLQM